MGTGNFFANSRPFHDRTVYAEFLDPETGRTWLGTTRNWEFRNGAWHWFMPFSYVADTFDERRKFTLEENEIWVVAYFEDEEGPDGRAKVIPSAPFFLRKSPVSIRRPSFACDPRASEGDRLQSIGQKPDLQPIDDVYCKSDMISFRMDYVDAFEFRRDASSLSPLK